MSGADWPLLRSQVDAALARISVRERQRDRRKRAGGVVLGITAAVAVSLAAISPVRSAVARLFTFGGERIEIVDKLPRLADPRPLYLGREIGFEQAPRLAGYRIVVPHLKRLGPPSQVYLQGTGSFRQVALLWGSPEKYAILLTQIPHAEVDSIEVRAIARKRLTHPPVRVSVRGRSALWIEGLHEYLHVLPGGDRRLAKPRVARNVLLWQTHDLQLRLEGRLGLREALAIARSVR